LQGTWLRTWNGRDYVWLHYSPISPFFYDDFFYQAHLSQKASFYNRFISEVKEVMTFMPTNIHQMCSVLFPPKHISRLNASALMVYGLKWKKMHIVVTARLYSRIQRCVQVHWFIHWSISAWVRAEILKPTLQYVSHLNNSVYLADRWALQ
jgi:hypothetical protein